MSRTNNEPAAPAPEPVTTIHTASHEASLRAEDPDLANEIYGDPLEKQQGTVTTGQPVREAPAAAAAPDPAAAAPAAATPDSAIAAPAASTPDPAPAPGASPMIPKARFDEVLARLDSLTERDRQREAELEALRQGATAPAAAAPAATTTTTPEFDLAAKLREKLQAQWDGNEDRVIEIELEIEQQRQAVATSAAVAAVQQTKVVESFQTQLNTAAAQIVTEYPALNSADPAASREAIAAFKAERDIQLNAGKDPVTAMNRAALLVAAEFGLQKAAPAAAATTTTTTTTPDPANPHPITARTLDVARIAAQTANTPPNNVGGMGQGDIQGSDGKSFTRDEWASMSTAQKNQALGIS